MPEGMFSFLIRGGNGGESVSRWRRKSPPRTLRLCSGQAAAGTKARLADSPGARFIVPLHGWGAWEIGRQGGGRGEGGLKPPLRMRIGDLLGGDLLGLELAVQGFEDPVLEDFAVAGLDCAEDQAEAGLAGVEDDCFGFERFAVFVNAQRDTTFKIEGGGSLDEAAHQAEFGDTAGESRLGRAFGSDFGGCIE